ncbi:MAG: alpha-2-macroglobulin, partial [Planctomycetaceae bacterium]
MSLNRSLWRIAPLFLVGVASMWLFAEEKPTPELRQKAQQALQSGNFRDAWQQFRALALHPEADRLLVGADVAAAVQAAQQVGEVEKVDEFLEAVAGVHAANWRLLQVVAETYMNLEHNGFQIAGEFQRGGHRGGGKWMNSLQRDRVRALQLMQQGLPLAIQDEDRPAVAQFHLAFARFLAYGQGAAEAWRLQTKTDLAVLPDYDEGYFYYGGQTRGAPVDAEGNPVYHKIPESWETAATDGERWRFMLTRVPAIDP